MDGKVLGIERRRRWSRDALARLGPWVRGRSSPSRMAAPSRPCPPAANVARPSSPSPSRRSSGRGCPRLDRAPMSRSGRGRRASGIVAHRRLDPPRYVSAPTWREKIEARRAGSGRARASPARRDGGVGEAANLDGPDTDRDEARRAQRAKRGRAEAGASMRKRTEREACDRALSILSADVTIRAFRSGEGRHGWTRRKCVEPIPIQSPKNAHKCWGYAVTQKYHLSIH